MERERKKSAQFYDDEKEKKKREMGSRNLNSQAKLMITEPSLSTL